MFGIARYKYNSFKIKSDTVFQSPFLEPFNAWDTFMYTVNH